MVPGRARRFAEARERAEESIGIAESVDHPFDLMVASFAVGILGLRQGTLDAAVPALERGIHLCKLGHIPFWFPLIASCLGDGYALRDGWSRPCLSWNRA